MGTGWTGTRQREILEDVHDVPNSALRTTTVISGGSFTQAPSGATKIIYGNSSIVSGATSTLISFLAPVTPVLYIQKLYLSGSQIGSFDIKQNGNMLFKVRGSNTQFSYVLDLATGSAFGLKLTMGDIIDIIATNNGNSVGDFEGMLQYMEAL